MVACPARGELRGYVVQDGSLGPDEMDQIEHHVEFCKLCQEVLEHLDEEEEPPGTTMPFLPGYRVYRHLGSGAFGEVWLAQDLNLPRVVAVKTLRFRSPRKEPERALDSLRRDAQLLTEVEHPNVVRVHVWLTVGDHHYLVMQHVPGGSLFDLLKADGPLDWQRAARYIADVGEGLLAVHRQGIVHRDVKPANILWDSRRDEALLTDFGVASRVSDPVNIAGSIPYMAPEAFDGRVSPSLDVYGLAATFFHLVTGSPPFPGVELSELRAQILRGLPDPDPRCTGLPEPLEKIIRSGLEPELQRRPTLQEFDTRLRAALNQLMADSLAMIKPTPSAPSTERDPEAAPRPPGQPTTQPGSPFARVDLRLTISRQVGSGFYLPVAATHPQPGGRITRDMKKVPPPPGQVRLHTGERVRIEVVADREGYLTVFNVGPTGNLNLLYPDGDPQRSASPVPAHRPLHVPDIELSPPAGRERLFAVWSRQALPLDQLAGLADQSGCSKPYRATRDMKRLQQAVHQLQTQDRHVAVVEVDHVS
jgi:serine/threonine protein kinase